MPGEFDFLDWIASQQKPHQTIDVGIGDDLAVLNWKDDLLLVGVDQVLDGVHFDSSVHSPRAIGRKAMNRNLSDCAAMACLPAAAVVSVALPREIGTEYAKELYLGLKEAADAFDFPIVGGDTASWAGKLAVSVTIFGRADGIRPIRRNGAKPGDVICVTGRLGGSQAGRHMNFEPLVHRARKLAKENQISAMIDLSDGLSRDLRHICRQSGVGALIDSARLPLHDDIYKLPKDDQNAAQHAVNDGEDYELLFTCPLCIDPGVHVIGEILEELPILWSTALGVQPLEPKGWEHHF